MHAYASMFIMKRKNIRMRINIKDVLPPLCLSTTCFSKELLKFLIFLHDFLVVCSVYFSCLLNAKFLFKYLLIK